MTEGPEGRAPGPPGVRDSRAQLEAIVKKETLAGAAELLGRIEGEYANVERALQEIT
jgi:hypothetical protein